MTSRPAAARIALVLLLGVLAALGTAGRAAAETEVYRPKHRLAAELVPLVETALGADGRVVADPGSNALVMVGTPQALDAARELLASVDRALRNVEVHYAQRSRSELEARGIEVRWRTEAGPVRIGTARRGKEGAEIRITGRDASQQGERAGRLRVLESQTGRIEAGSLVAFETGGPWHRRTELVEATSGLEVTPRILADGRVRLTLRPYGARPTAQGLAVQGAETELVVEPGETAVVGGLTGGATRRHDDALSGTARAAEREELLLLIRVETP